MLKTKLPNQPLQQTGLPHPNAQRSAREVRPAAERQLVRRLGVRFVAPAVLGLAFACAELPPEQLPTTVGFAALPSTDLVRVQVVVVGCWGHSAFDLEVHGGEEPLVRGTRLEGSWSDESHAFIVKRRSESREAHLTQDDLRDLDGMLRYYRAGPPDGCSDRHIVSVTQVRGERSVVTERYIDDSCGDGEIEGVTTFWDLIECLDLPE